MTQPIHPPKKRVLLVAMTGKASAAKTATGPELVCAYIASFGREAKIPVVGEFARSA